MNRSFNTLVLRVALGACIALPARAEPPMNVDDAGTLDQGGMKIEGALGRDNKARGGELVFGFAPVETLEVGLSLARAIDRDDEPSTRLHGMGIGFKWVPIQSKGDAGGWSLGASFSHGRTRVDERVTPDKYTEKEYALSGLATYRFASEQVVHLNLGATRVKAQGSHATLGTWGVGFEQPWLANLKLTAEIFGAERSRPDKALGLRYTVTEGLKVSAAFGRGNDRNFIQAGFAWEF